MKTKETALQRREMEQAVVKEEQRMDNNMETVSQLQLISTLQKKTEKLLITTAELKEMLSCSRQTAEKIGKEAGARFQIGRAVRWKVNNIRDYLNKQEV